MRTRWLVVVVVVVAGGGLTWWWLHKPASKPVSAVAQPVAMRVSTVVTGDLERWITVVGSLIPRDEVRVATDGVGGKIIELAADVGDQVTAGQMLARLDPLTAEIQLASALAAQQRAVAAVAQQAALQREAEAAQAEAESALRRIDSVTANIISDEARDQRRTAVVTAAARAQAAAQAQVLAQAEVAQAAAQERQAREAVARTTVRAPTAGVVLERNARLGAVVKDGDILFTLLQDGVVECVAEVTEDVIPSLAIGQEVTLTAAGVSGHGTVRRIDPAVEVTTRLGSVRIALTPMPGWLPGLSARGQIHLTTDHGPLVPRSALLEDERGAAVLVVEDGKVQRRVVSKLVRGAEQVLVGAGLRAGERIVTASPNFLPDGELITPIESQP